ncbi:MAG TPA: 30S ribosomal protein S8 [Puia sp.]|jgi:small subunit ribosomal protein S8|nr:30S ribosomal protein S8 [Puia sp.]
MDDIREDHQPGIINEKINKHFNQYKMVTDPIADFLTRIRNAQMANHRIVEIPASNLKRRMTEILYDKGYILKYKFEDDRKQGVIKIALKYDPQTREPAIRSLERVSRPGLRQYASPVEFKRVKNGLGIAIVSTSKGVMTDKDAKAQNVGGEVLCHVY